MLRSGLIATKIGNSSFYHDNGTNTHVTVLKIDECIVSNVKTTERDLKKIFTYRKNKIEQMFNDEK